MTRFILGSVLVLTICAMGAQSFLPYRRAVRESGGASDVLDDLVAHWKLDEASGTREDFVGSNDLTDNNTVTSGTGVIGDAAEFVKANNEFLSIADNPALSMGNIDMSITLWVKFTSVTGYHTLVGKVSDLGVASNTEYVIYLELGKINWRISSGSAFGTVATAATMSVDTWYFVHVYHDAAGDEIGISIDDGTYATTSTSIGIVDGTKNFYLGTDGNSSRALYGFMDSVSIGKRLFTSEEITALYSLGAP